MWTGVWGQSQDAKAVTGRIGNGHTCLRWQTWASVWPCSMRSLAASPEYGSWKSAGARLSRNFQEASMHCMHGRVFRDITVQGISGRRLLDNAERAGRALRWLRDPWSGCFAGSSISALQVEYEVVELHPTVAMDARQESARRTKAQRKALMHASCRSACSILCLNGQP